MEETKGKNNSKNEIWHDVDQYDSWLLKDGMQEYWNKQRFLQNVDVYEINKPGAQYCVLLNKKLLFFGAWQRSYVDNKSEELQQQFLNRKQIQNEFDHTQQFFYEKYLLNNTDDIKQNIDYIRIYFKIKIKIIQNQLWK